jgi:glycosyltransferase involved in cell wall biosynthesis
MEGFGIACIEASARGVPVIASDCDGLVDAVVDGKTGTHFKTHDKTSCINAIEHKLTHPLDRNAISQATLDAFGWGKIIDLYRTHVFRP